MLFANQMCVLMWVTIASLGPPRFESTENSPPSVKHIDLLNLVNMEFPMKSYHMVQYYKHADSNPRVFIAPSKYIQGPGYSHVYL